MDADYQEGALLNKKMSVLESNGSFVDCAFLVHKKGSILDENLKLYGVKRDIQLASPVLARLIGESEKLTPDVAPPIIKITDTHFATFKILLQYVHCSVIPEGLNLKQIIYLSVAAKRYEVAPLIDACASLLEAVVDITNIWPTLDCILKKGFPEAAAGCKRLLVNETQKCIQHPSFLICTQRTVLFLLEQNKLNLPSEAELLKTCQKWAKQEGRNYEQSMKQFVHQLRLLSLDPEILISLKDVLGPEELGKILSHIYSGGKVADLPKPLCPTASRLLPAPIEKKVTIIPDEWIWGPDDCRSESVLSRKQIPGMDTVEFKFYFQLRKRPFFITGFEILHQVHPIPTVEFNSSSGCFEEKPLDDYYEENLEFSINYSVTQKFEQRVRYNSSTFIKLNEAKYVDNCDFLIIKIHSLKSERCIYRNISQNDVEKRFKDMEHELVDTYCSLDCPANEGTLIEEDLLVDMRSCFFLKSFSYVLCQD